MDLSTAANFAQVVSVVPLVGAPLIWLRHHQCDSPGCRRLARHPVPGTQDRVCRRHHSREHHAQLLDRHRRRGLA